MGIGQPLESQSSRSPTSKPGAAEIEQRGSDFSSPHKSAGVERQPAAQGGTLTLQIPVPRGIHGYKLIRCIGAGSYGEVWLAQNEVVHTYCAIKVVYEDRFDDPGPFNREFRGLQRSVEISRSHAGLVDILHVGRNDAEGFFYYVMELADGLEGSEEIKPDRYKPKALNRLLLKNGRMPLDECLRLGLALTDALAHLHKHGLIHRDIKPANIVFIEGVPKIVDIGLVTRIQDSKTLNVGTPEYMPPEVVAAAGGCTEECGKPDRDLYSLGRVLYCMATGNRPENFHDMQPGSGEIAHRPGGLEFFEVLGKACARDPVDRYQTAEEMQIALKHAAQAANQPPAPLPPPEDRAQMLRRSRAVSIIYKSNVQPDGRLLDLLESKLREHGHSVFIDRHLSIGVRWAQEIEAKIRNSDALIVLLSAASIQSEMVAYEVEIAQDAAQQNGKPALLPVRVAYDGSLSEPLSRVLNPLQHITWKSSTDDQRIIREVLRALEHPPTTRNAPSSGPLAPPVGVVPLDSEHYVVRKIDQEFLAAVERQDSIVLVKGARQMGKTSLLARGLEHARKSGRKVVITDFQMLNASDLESAETLFKALAGAIDTDLELNTRPIANWDAQTGANLNFRKFMEKEVLRKLTSPVVWGLDEVDRLLTCSFGSEVFGLFRAWHNRRSLEPSGPWSRLTLAIAYATEAHLFITDINQSPFNVGTRLTLEDFNFSQVADLNRRYGAPLCDNAELTRFFELVGGHPYLVRRGLHELVSCGIGISDFAKTASGDEGIFGDHLRRILVMLAKNQPLLEAVRAMLRGRPCSTQENFYRLRTAGIFKGDSIDQASPRCQVYETYLQHHLL